MEIKNILIAYDFEDQAYALLETATTMARKFNSKIFLLHVSSPNVDYSDHGNGGKGTVRDQRAEQLKMERKVLQQVKDQLTDDGFDTETFLIQGQVVKTILEQTEKLQIDLVIIGHHEGLGLHKLLFGDTSATLVKRSPIPILTVPVDK
jgi:nucleotide-binding universal stress UspA family protein